MKRNWMIFLSVCMIFFLLSGCETQEKADSSSEEPASKPIAEIENPAPSSEPPEEGKVEIVRDPEVGLQVKKAPETNIAALMKTIASEGSFSAAGHDVSLDHVRAYVSVSQLRPISVVGSNSGSKFYSTHDSSSGGRLFVFYGWGPEVYSADYSCFIAKSLFMKDFDELTEGSSTLEDVEKIDPAAKVNFFNRDATEPNYYVSFLDQSGLWGDYDYYSVHAARDGIVNIGYQKNGEDFMVHEIRKLEYLVIDGEIRDPVAAINEKDWP